MSARFPRQVRARHGTRVCAPPKDVHSTAHISSLYEQAVCARCSAMARLLLFIALATSALVACHADDDKPDKSRDDKCKSCGLVAQQPCVIICGRPCLDRGSYTTKMS